ncbi:hypothetical protein [Qipengyuania qiaonensis]|uniref:Amino acid permease n=1 Tax=Qipengyuania qiaonensis TaxID=2867240 RepID=A0ABS7J5K8_9SPHN|nr:hypothetical protein [Qipengyuania qiaonensis]MBX7482621.1 hypothetical protein [Qipengyuania qiaonensis]
MLTTVIAAIDAYARSLPAAIQVLRGAEQETGTRAQYVGSTLILAVLAVVALFTMMREFTAFLDFVTSATFLVAPLLALLNYLVVTRCEMPEKARPSPAMKVLSLAGVVVMGALAVMYFALV